MPRELIAQTVCREADHGDRDQKAADPRETPPARGAENTDSEGKHQQTVDQDDVTIKGRTGDPNALSSLIV